MQRAKNFPNHEDNIKITANSDTKNIFQYLRVQLKVT